MANVILFLFGEQRSGSGKSQVDPAHGGPRETDTHQVGLPTGYNVTIPNIIAQEVLEQLPSRDGVNTLVKKKIFSPKKW